MDDHPTPESTGQEPAAWGDWRDEFADPTDIHPHALFHITGGWAGGLTRFRRDGRLDVAFHGLTDDQAQRLYRAARDAGLLTRAVSPEAAHIYPYMRRLFRCYRRTRIDEGRTPTHAECARRADDISEEASRKRLQRAGLSWERLTEWWDKTDITLSQWDKNAAELSQ